MPVVAIASNEAYFLPQWVYHHFYFGFNAIDIYINRTSDNSDRILQKLKLAYQGLNIVDWNFLDYTNSASANSACWSLQPNAYTFAYLNSSNFDYILFIDIDEFYTPLNFKDTIQDCILRFDSPDAIMLTWLVSPMQPEYVMPIFSRHSIPINMPTIGKTLLKTGLPINKAHVHLPDMANISSMVDGNGQQLDIANPANRLSWTTPGTPIPNYFILHDWNRSWVAHLAKLGVRDSNNLDAPFEHMMRLTSRLIAPCTGSNPAIHHVLENRIEHDYLKGFKSLIERLNMQSDLDKALLFLYYSALETVFFVETRGDNANLDKFYAMFGDLKKIKKRLIRDISAMTGNGISVEDYDRINWEEIETNNHDETVRNYQIAISIFPYLIDGARHPLFLKKYISWLIGEGQIQEAECVFINYKLHSCYPTFITWANLEFANAYEKQGDMLRCFKYLSKLKLADNASILQRYNQIKAMLSCARKQEGENA